MPAPGNKPHLLFCKEHFQAMSLILCETKTGPVCLLPAQSCTALGLVWGHLVGQRRAQNSVLCRSPWLTRA